MAESKPFDWAAHSARLARVEARKTLPARLRAATPEQAPALLEEAAVAVEELLALVDRQRRDAIEEQLQVQRDFRDAVSEAVHRNETGDPYGTY